MLKRLSAGFALMLLSALAFAEGPAFVELKSPIPTDSPGKIEVVEYFWYGCPHCYALEPHLQKWVTQAPSDVVFKRIPAPANEVWKAASRTFYALEAMGLQAKLHKPLFDAVQLEHLRLNNAQQLDDWLSRQNVDVQKYRAMENSFAVESKIKRASQFFDMSQANGVPTIVVDGRYVVEMANLRTPEAMMQTVNQLVERVRAAKTPAKK
ncbi:MAG TPA: thiol:disulfide interchange protein DsbA/DsbL [Burkholderiales bacterium]|nr:thiol:disulfide interchange protein DsbA/DsbL [Burkholderiales bacterium]